jgi:uncharacterized protein with HEPN domain
MNKDPHYLLDMLNAAKLILIYTSGKTFQEFFEDTFFQDAVTRRIEILGEAARRVSNLTRAEIPDIAWHQIVGMRNVIAHEYNDIDLEVVWRVIQVELPRLIPILEKVIADRTE